MEREVLRYESEVFYMSNLKTIKLPSRADHDVFLRVIPGHFATNHSHINHYIDMTTLKSRKSEAQGAAKILAQSYSMTTIIDTIICMDGTEVLGAYLAEELQQSGLQTVNIHKSIYIVSPETDSSGQLVLRDNTRFMVEGKNVLLLLGTATTGITLQRMLQCVQYYGGHMAGICSLFSAIRKANGIPVVSLFGPKDLPEYHTFSFTDCPMCKAGKRLDGMVNVFGYSLL